METYVCPACKSVLNADRKEAHETLWCPALPQSDEDEPEEPQKGLARMGGARAGLSPLCQETVLAVLASRPDLCFALEQRDIFGPLDTGGALWYADRVLSQFLVTAGMSTAFGEFGARGYGGGGEEGESGLALVLGCGGVPLSALVAGALGWNVVMTDLEPVLELTRANVRRNAGVVQGERDRRGCARSARLVVQELYFGDEQALDTALAAGSASVETGSADGASLADKSQPLLVLCSDCIWREFLHRPLLATVAHALRKAPGPAAALMCYQTRSPQNEGLFMKLLGEEFCCLELQAVDTSEALAEVRWPDQVLEGVGNLDLPESFPLLRLTLRAGVALPPLSAPDMADAERKPWWS